MHEMWTGEEPYSGHEGGALLHMADIIKDTNYLRPAFPSFSHQKFAALASQCWHHDPHSRPTFDQIVPQLLEIRKELTDKFFMKG